MRTFHQFDYDLAAAPLVFIRYPDTLTMEVVPTAFEFYLELSREFGRVAYLFDMRRFNPLAASARIRGAFNEHFERNRAALERATVCEAFVHESALTRGIITAVNWLRTAAYPTRQFTDDVAARKWVVSRLEAEGLTPGATPSAEMQAIHERLMQLSQRRP